MAADTDGLELLNTVQDHFHFVQLHLQFGVERSKDFFERFFQIAVSIDRINQRECNQLISFRQRNQVELPFQMTLQGLARAGSSGKIPFVVILAGS